MYQKYLKNIVHAASTLAACWALCCALHAVQGLVVMFRVTRCPLSLRWSSFCLVSSEWLGTANLGLEEPAFDSVLLLDLGI